MRDRVTVDYTLSGLLHGTGNRNGRAIRRFVEDWEESPESAVRGAPVRHRIDADAWTFSNIEMPLRGFPPATVWLLIVATIGCSWQGMQMVHEAGHVIGAWLTGGEVQRVVLHPLTILRTDVSPNPHPLVVVWLGPALGVALPVLLWLVVRGVRPGVGYLARFFAGFCLVANGTYIGAGAAWPIGDAETMRRLGVPGWIMTAFSAACVAAGFALWHGLGPSFGLDGKSRGNPRHAAGVVAAYLLLVLLCAWN
jgi:hypothetical protein